MRNDEVIQQSPFPRSAGLIFRVDDPPPHQLQETGRGELLWRAVEVRRQYPRALQYLQPRGCRLQQFAIGIVVYAYPIVHVQAAAVKTASHSRSDPLDVQPARRPIAARRGHKGIFHANVGPHTHRHPTRWSAVGSGDTGTDRRRPLALTLGVVLQAHVYIHIYIYISYTYLILIDL